MSAHQNRSSIHRRAAQSIAALCLISGVLAQSTLCRGQNKPDEIIFTNGDHLTGTLEKAVGDTIIFKSDIVGEVSVPMAKIKELHSNGSFAVLKKGEEITRTSKKPGTITYADNAITVAVPSGPPETIQVKDLAFVIDQATYNKEVNSNPGFFHGWHGGITGGATILEATDTGQSYTAAINLIRPIPSVPFLPARTRTTFNLIESYGKLTSPTVPQTTPPTPDAVAKTSIFHTDVEHDKYFSPRFYGLIGASFDHNFSQGLNFQQIYGVGLGLTVVQTPVQEFDVKADVHYERQNFQPPTPSLDLIGSTFAEAYRRNLPAKLIFTESGSYIQSWNDFHANSAILAAGLQLPVYKRFSLNVSVLDNYLNNPAFGYKKNSFQFISGVTYTLP